MAELPYPVALTPLATDALLVAGEAWNQLLLSIENNQLRFRPELNELDDPPPSRPQLWTLGGTWPENTWLALSNSSDAGPSSADVYQWRDSRWVKKHEHASGIVDLALWRGNLAIQGSWLSVPVLVEQALHELSSTASKRLSSSVCSPTGASLLAPIRVHDDALNVFGYECGKNGQAPEGGMALLVETWSASGVKSRRRMPLPHDLPLLDQLLIDQHGLAAVLPKHDAEPRRLARFIEGRWQTVAALPPELVLLPSPRSFELWAVVGSQLRAWQGSDWSAMELPAGALPSGAEWKSVWRRAPGDVWLIGGTPEKSWLFNSADGKKVTPLPSKAEHSALGEKIWRERTDCPRPFADVLALAPLPLGDGAQLRLSPAKARTMLGAALRRHPELRHLEFVHHGCYGQDCVGALVKDADEADALRSALGAGDFARDGLRCHPPPVTQPFAVPR